MQADYVFPSRWVVGLGCGLQVGLSAAFTYHDKPTFISVDTSFTLVISKMKSVVSYCGLKMGMG